MFKRILVPLDGSERAERALPIAARLARASHGTLIVVQVLDIDMTLYIAPEMMVSESVVEAESSAVGQYLTQVTASFTQEGIPVELGVLLGVPASILLSAIASYNADLVVMCSHGRTGFMRWALGSVAEKIARSSPIPTLVLREHGSIPTSPYPDQAHSLRILVPLDGSAASKTAIKPAAALIAALAAPATGAMHLTRVVQPAPGDVPVRYQRSLDDLLQKTKLSLQKTVENLRDGFEVPSVASLDLGISCSVVINEDIAETIIRIAEHGEEAEGVSIPCDIIAMATHGRTGIDHLALGSITERVVHATQLPVLIVPMPSKVVPQAADARPHEHSAALPQ